MTDLSELEALVGRADDRLGGISIDRLDGDNISILFCTYFESADEDADENGWTESATSGCDEMLEAIRAHYRPAFDAARSKIESLLSTIRSQEAALVEAREALYPFAGDWAFQHDGPDDEVRCSTANGMHIVGVYAFRRAVSALSKLEGGE